MVIKNHYSKEFRDAVLTAYFTSDESCAAIALRFNVDKVTLGAWIHRNKNK